jgi:hypothetical protein
MEPTFTKATVGKAWNLELGTWNLELGTEIKLLI